MANWRTLIAAAGGGPLLCTAVLFGSGYHLAAKSDAGAASTHVAAARRWLQEDNGVAAEAALRNALAAGADPVAMRPLLAHAFLLEGQPKRALQMVLGNADMAQAGYAALIEARIRVDMNDPGAEAALDRALAITPDNALLWNDIARFRSSHGDGVGAIEAIEKALSLDARLVPALIQKAALDRDATGIANAVPTYRRLLEIAPDMIAGLVGYAATLAELGHAREALSVSRHIQRLDKNNIDARLIQATIAARAGHYRLARNILYRLGPAGQDRPAYLLLAAVTEARLGNHHVAADLAQRLLVKQPENIVGRKLVAHALYATGDYRGTLTALAPLVAGSDVDSWPVLMAARAHEALGEPDVARRLIAHAAAFRRSPAMRETRRSDLGVLAADAAQHPLDPAYVLPFVRAQLQRGKTDGLLVMATRLRDRNRTIPDSHLLLGDVRRATGDVAGAVAAYREANALRFDAVSALRLAWAQQAMGDTRGAFTTLARQVMVNPEQVDVNRALAPLYLARKDYARAAATYDMVRARLGNGDALLMYELGIARLALHQWSLARDALAHAYAGQPANAAISSAYGYALALDGEQRAGRDLMVKATQMDRHNPVYAARLAQFAG